MAADPANAMPARATSPPRRTRREWYRPKLGGWSHPLAIVVSLACWRSSDGVVLRTVGLSAPFACPDGVELALDLRHLLIGAIFEVDQPVAGRIDTAQELVELEM